jgi:hypothetical protein
MLTTNLDIAHPLVHAILLAFDIHHSWRTTATQQDEDIVEGRRLLKLGHFFPACDMVRPDQSIMEALHRFLKAK